MALQVKNIQNNIKTDPDKYKLKFHINDSKTVEDQDKMLQYIQKNVQDKKDDIRNMLENLQSDLQQIVPGVFMDINENCVKTTASINSKFKRIMAENPNADAKGIYQEMIERDLIRGRIKLKSEEDYFKVID